MDNEDDPPGGIYSKQISELEKELAKLSEFKNEYDGFFLNVYEGRKSMNNSLDKLEILSDSIHGKGYSNPEKYNLSSRNLSLSLSRNYHKIDEVVVKKENYLRKQIEKFKQKEEKYPAKQKNPRLHKRVLK
jgi:hypothetical protein